MRDVGPTLVYWLYLLIQLAKSVGRCVRLSGIRSVDVLHAMEQTRHAHLRVRVPHVIPCLYFWYFTHWMFQLHRIRFEKYWKSRVVETLVNKTVNLWNNSVFNKYIEISLNLLHVVTVYWCFKVKQWVNVYRVLNV